MNAAYSRLAGVRRRTATDSGAGRLAKPALCRSNAVFKLRSPTRRPDVTGNARLRGGSVPGSWGRSPPAFFPAVAIINRIGENPSSPAEVNKQRLEVGGFGFRLRVGFAANAA